MRLMKAGVVGLLVLVPGVWGWAQEAPRGGQVARDVVWPGLTEAGRVQLPNGWRLEPAGKQVPLGDFPITMAECPTAPVLAVLHAGYGTHEVMTLDAKSGELIGRVAVHETFGGLVWTKDGKTLYVGGGFDDVIYRFRHEDGFLRLDGKLTYEGGDLELAEGKAEKDEPLVRAERGSKRPQGCISGLALADGDRTLWAGNAFAHRLARFELETGKLTAEVALGEDTYPYGVVVDEGRKRVYVSLWGQKKVAVVDSEKNEKVETWETGPHPNEMLMGKDGEVLFVANANENTVTVHELEPEEHGKAVETIGTAIDPMAPAGCTPSALATSKDGTILFVANANTNDVAVVNVEEPGESRGLGFVPAGWYPTCVRVSRDGETLWIANGKGTHSLANREGPMPTKPGESNRTRQYIGGLFRGTLSSLKVPGVKELKGYSETVYACSPVKKEEPKAVRGAEEKNPIPAKVGGESPIKYCVYIIKENRTYDQVFGDMPEGNGEPAICLFPEKVTPNHHALAREFVLLDNFYVESEVSADGHEWTMGAYATDFVERLWPLSYRGDRRVPYPAEGKFDQATPAGGYLWDRAKEKGVSYRSYGEFVTGGKAEIPVLEGHFDPEFPSYDLSKTDVSRAERFLEELKGFEEKGEMPRLVVMRLPNDHTSGTRPGARSVLAYVGDNDLALGMVVEGLSRSKFWKEMAIFVVEDDAQNGSDHVDAHRTVALAISPYIKRHSVDSSMYSTSSMLRTMEVILGLEPMSQFDAAARVMSRSFTMEADFSPYEHRAPGVDLKEINTANAPGAKESMELDLSREDRADDITFNEIIWKAVKGKDSVMPAPVRAAFVMPRPEEEDEDEDED